MPDKQQRKRQHKVPPAALETAPSGLETLLALSRAGSFNRWMFEEIAPFCRGNMLEAGSGIGNLSVQILAHGHAVLLSDMHLEHCERLAADFSHFSNLLGIRQIDLADPEFETRHRDLLGAFDTVVAFNVIEHIEDDLLAIRNCRRLLRKGGRLVVLVPAFQWLYNGLDLQLQHCRRYNARSMRTLVAAAGMEPLHARYFNALGIPGWFFSGRVQRNRVIPGYQVALFNAMVPFARLLDKCSCRMLGLSVIQVARA